MENKIVGLAELHNIRSKTKTIVNKIFLDKNFFYKEDNHLWSIQYDCGKDYDGYVLSLGEGYYIDSIEGTMLTIKTNIEPTRNITILLYGESQWT